MVQHFQPRKVSEGSQKQHGKNVEKKRNYPISRLIWSQS